MASLLYNSVLSDMATGAIDFDTDTFKVELVTATYTADKDHARRSSVTNEVTGTGYTAGGAATTVTVTPDNTNDRLDITFSSVSWPTATITARAAVIYKVVGGVAANEPLVAYADFGSNVVSTGGTFSVTFTSPFRIQN